LFGTLAIDASRSAARHPPTAARRRSNASCAAKAGGEV
jgi:hypothetical protein